MTDTTANPITMRYTVRVYPDPPESGMHTWLIKATCKRDAIDIAIQKCNDLEMNIYSISIPSPGIPLNKLKRKKPSKRKYKMTPEQWANCD